MDTQVLIDKLTSAISYKFKDDQTAPGLTISKLKHGYYCSVVRYNGPIAQGKIVVCKARADNLTDALKAVAQDFLAQSNQPKNPVDELGDLVKGV